MERNKNKHRQSFSRIIYLILPAKTLLLCNILWGFFGGGFTFMKSKINVTHVKFKYSPISYL